MTMSHSRPTLSTLDSELAQLYTFRESISRDPEITPQEQVDSLRAIEGQIEGYLRRLEDKADGIAEVLGEFGIRAETCKAKSKHEAERAKMWEERIAHLEATTLRVLMMRPEGKRRIETASTTLKVAKNPPSVDVYDKSEVPKPYMRRTVTLNADLFDRLMGCLMVTKEGALLFQELQEAKTTDPEPMKTEIGKELKAGIAVPGCKLIDDRVRLVVE